LLPFVALEFAKQTWRQREQERSLGKAFTRALNPLHVVGGLVGVIALVFFSANRGAQVRGWHCLNPILALSVILLEGGVVWACLGGRQRKDPAWYLAGLALFAFPFIRIGRGFDFMMRASIPALIHLMVWVGEAISCLGTSRWLRAFLIVCLCLGALTPAYEINRSVYRTACFFLSGSCSTVTRAPGPFEDAHPGMLTADLPSVVDIADRSLLANSLGTVEESLFDRYLAAHR